MNRSAINILIISVFLIVLTGCGGTVPVRNVENASSVVSDVSLENVEKAIKRAAIKRGWTTKEAGEGHLVATIVVRSHMAKVDITYNTKTYSINYNDSAGLKYVDGNIHSKYNSWITNLQRDIDLQLSAL